MCRSATVGSVMAQERTPSVYTNEQPSYDNSIAAILHNAKVSSPIAKRLLSVVEYGWEAFKSQPTWYAAWPSVALSAVIHAVSDSDPYFAVTQAAPHGLPKDVVTALERIEKDIFPNSDRHAIFVHHKIRIPQRPPTDQAIADVLLDLAVSQARRAVGCIEALDVLYGPHCDSDVRAVQRFVSDVLTTAALYADMHKSMSVLTEQDLCDSVDPPLPAHCCKAHMMKHRTMQTAAELSLLYDGLELNQPFRFEMTEVTDRLTKGPSYFWDLSVVVKNGSHESMYPGLRQTVPVHLRPMWLKDASPPDNLWLVGLNPPAEPFDNMDFLNNRWTQWYLS